MYRDSTQKESGILLVGLGLMDQARKTYETAIAATGIDSNVYLTWLGLVTTYARAGAAAMHEQILARGLESTQDPEWLFELADAALIAGDAAAARGFTDKALKSPDLKPIDLASPWLARTGYSNLLIAAAAEQATGDHEAAMLKLAQLSTLLDRLTAAGMRRHGVYELQAQIAALRGDAEAAMVACCSAPRIRGGDRCGSRSISLISLRCDPGRTFAVSWIVSVAKNAAESAKIDIDAAPAAQRRTRENLDL